MNSVSARNPNPRTVLLALAGSWWVWGASEASDWSRWRGPEGTGISTEKGWTPEALAGAKIKWSARLGDGHSSVSVAGKRLFTMGNRRGSDIVYALDAESGTELWKHWYPCVPGDYDGPRATPVVDGDFLYTLSREGQALCLEAATGKVKWQKQLVRDFGATEANWGFAGSPLLLGKTVLYNARSSGLALDQQTGEKVWESRSGPCGYAAPVHFIHKGKDCVGFFGAKEISVVDARTGARLYSHPWETQYDVNAADPVYFEGKLFISSGYGRGCSLLDLSGETVAVVWENKNLRGHFASPIYLDGHLYGIDGNTGEGQLRCLEASSGNVRWAQAGGFENLMIASGMILTIDRKGVLVVARASPDRFTEVARAEVLSGKATNWTAPVLANGCVYCRSGKGELVCLDVR